MDLADEFDGLLIDLDGVVWVGREMVPGAVETLGTLLADGMEIVFVTNNPGRRASVYAERLRKSGLEIGDERVVTAGDATARLVAERIGRDGRAFVIGAPAFRESVAETGLELVEGIEPHGDSGDRLEAEAVVVSGHRDFDYAELFSATRALQGGAALFATSRDPTLPMPGGAWPGTGAILAAVEAATGASAEIGGKPERHLFELARERLGDAERVAMVGDRVSSDIAGGKRAGLATVLVLSGATSHEEAEAADPRPDRVVENLAALAAS